MPNHSPEPWEYREERQGEYLGAIWSGSGPGEEGPHIIADLVAHKEKSQQDLSDARRIVAAVNFCRDLPTGFLERHKLPRDAYYRERSPQELV